MLKQDEFMFNADPSEAILKGTPSKVNFTVSIQTPINNKFNEIHAYYQLKHQYGKVYKHQVLQLIIDEVYNNMKGKRLL